MHSFHSSTSTGKGILVAYNLFLPFLQGLYLTCKDKEWFCQDKTFGAARQHLLAGVGPCGFLHWSWPVLLSLVFMSMEIFIEALGEYSMQFLHMLKQEKMHETEKG